MHRMPTEVLRRVHRLKQRYGEKLVKVFDFKLEFTRENFLPEYLFERLVCAVAAKMNNLKGEITTKLYRREVTFSFLEHYVFAKLYPLHIQVWSINSNARGETTSQFSLRVFLECALEVLASDGEMYDVLLGFHANGEPHVMRYAGIHTDNSQVQNIWLNGESFANTYAKWWGDCSPSLARGRKSTKENDQEQLVLLYDERN